MKKRLLTLGLLAAVTQVFSTGCCHLVARYRAKHDFQPFNCNRYSYHPCSLCDGCGAFAGHRHWHKKALHVGSLASAPCDCDAGPGVLVGYSAIPTIGPASATPSIGYPIPLTPGPTVVPSHPTPLPVPMPLPSEKDKGTSKSN